jgi:predicted secreted protein
MNGWRPSRRWGWALSVLLAWLAMGCATLERDIVASPLDGGAVTLRKGNALVVSLAPDPAAGYGWVLKSADPSMRRIGGPDYTQDPKPPGLAGMAATTTYRFRATQPGTSTIEFAWVAPPGQPPAPDKVVRYRVTVLPPEYFGLL